ncbi:MAG: glycosyltransferase [Acidobacteria bacterium]|nr:glycosyltransferase [Acidobacteriota bacterium]
MSDPEVREALVLMARAPIEGAVKTRLVGMFTPPEVLELYLNFLHDTFRMMEEVRTEREGLAIVLCFTPEGTEEAFEEVDREGCLMMAQRGGDLGERLLNCFDDLFAQGYERVVVIGADSPALPVEYVLDAFDELTDSQTVTFGPTVDGGYYLVGLRQPSPALFHDISWGTAEVFATTRARANAAGLRLVELPEFFDIDTPPDLDLLDQVLAEDPELAPRTRRCLRRLRRAGKSS